LSDNVHCIEYQKACIRFNDTFSLTDIDWTLKPNEVWAIVGASGSGKSALAASLAGDGDLCSGTITGLNRNTCIVSLQSQAELIERERLRDDSDITDKISDGTAVRELISEVSVSPDLLQELLDVFSLDDLLNRGFRKLSTGETRKVLITRALTSKPGMVVIDGPFEGLDQKTVPMLSGILQKLARQTPMVLVINRLDELPEYVTHLAYLETGQLVTTTPTGDQAAMDLISQHFHLKNSELLIPAASLAESSSPVDSNDPLVNIRQASIRYTDNLVFENLDWRIEPGQHWQLTGPNGSGKTCLLNLITGDHPQCYSNDIFVCGYKRGNGESIWDIKQHIGYVSSALQWDYRVGTSCSNVIISGFYDSIGLYTKATDLQKDIAAQWLSLLGMVGSAGQPFNQRSYGDQRLLLIARAMVKHPHLLILDEPCFGLDDLNRQLVLALIEKICAGSETTVIYVNHHAQDRIEGIEHYLSLV
jgi:molybdate transport system ATP-binding protein